MSIAIKENGIPFYIGIGFLLCVVAIELFAILRLNNGMLVYTLDDPYIHLALAEKIINGHYGININEFSAPASSILFPFILAPVSSYVYSPFLINIVCAVATVIVLVRTLNVSFDITDRYTSNIFISVIAILFILSTNMVGLVFAGMEHSLQVLAALLIAYGIIVEIEENTIKWWLLAAIIVAPLVRYECIAISISAVFYIAMQRRFKLSVFVLVSLAVLLVGFSIFLVTLGLGPIPSSVLAKSHVVRTGGMIGSFMVNLKDSLSTRQGTVLSFGVLTFVLYVLSGSHIKRKQLAVAVIFAAFLHLIAGRFDSYGRYEIYIWSFLLIVGIYLFAPIISNYLADNNKSTTNLATAIIFAVGVAIASSAPYIRNLKSLPIASNNVYEQQYQMHRFAVDYYKMPVAINDLGYVSYNNSNYVLDLWGLASIKILKARIYSSNYYEQGLKASLIGMVENKIDEKNIGLVMIYDNLFVKIPDKWVKIGKLHLSKRRIANAESSVDFYATNQDVYLDIVKKMNNFIKTLPAGVKFTFQQSGS